MCGITGYFHFGNPSEEWKNSLHDAVHTLKRRGPDHQAVYTHQNVGLGHARLSIIDTSAQAHQPMTDASGRYTLVFNGEIFNYRDLQPQIGEVPLQSHSDTEVLLHLLIQQGIDCLPKLNGFFAFAFYDHQENTVLLARDRMGIKPLHYFLDSSVFCFASEMKAMVQYPIPRVLDEHSLYWYLRLNYLPAELSMLKGVQKLLPGHWMRVNKTGVEQGIFWKPERGEPTGESYQASQQNLLELLEASVKRRLISDVPLGAFLSGGTDSSAVVALAARHHQKLNTFSIGYRDQPFFDETRYAELVARKFNTNHHVFSLTNDDLLADIGEILDYIDEPFADSSAIPTYILAKHVRQHVTVALSGDGADELFGGYYKHLALKRAGDGGWANGLLKAINPLLSRVPQSRSGKWANLARRLHRYANMLKLSPAERYWFLASMTHKPEGLLAGSVNTGKIRTLKQRFLKENPDFPDYLLADLQVLLPGDMLTKVDLMSMANSLEVRVPFLDKEVVAFANALPDDFKVKGSERKRIVQDAFRNILPEELYHRPKKGFEVPLLQWMRNELLSELDAQLFDPEYLQEQGVFRVSEVVHLRKTLLSSNPGDVHGTVWALYVFQKWYKRMNVQAHSS